MMRSNEVKRFKAAITALINDYYALLTIAVIITMLLNIPITVWLVPKFVSNNIIHSIIILCGLFVPFLGASFLSHEYKIENNIKDNDY